MDATTYPYLEGRDVGAFVLNWSKSWMRYGDWLSQPRVLAQFTRPRILLREITAPLPYCLSACFTDEPYLSNKSILSVLDAEDDPVKLKALACVLNSALMSVFYKEYAVKSARRLFPKVLIRNLREYPFPQNPNGKMMRNLANLHDRLVTAIAALQEAKPHETDARRRLAVALRTQIDQAVETFYGLTPTEVTLVRRIARPGNAADVPAVTASVTS